MQKLSIGGSAEKIVSAFHLVLNDHLNEVSEMSRCKSAVNRVRKMDHDVELACAQVKDPKRKILAKDLGNEENTLRESIEKLKSVETNRVALVAQLREALQEQESELENIRKQMQVAQAHAEEVHSMRKWFNDESYVAGKSKRTAADIAAEVADKLAASSSSQLMMSSVLSTLAAEALSNTDSTPAKSASDNTNSNPDPSTSASDPNGHASEIPSHQYQLQQYTTTPALVSHGYGSLPPVPPPMPSRHAVGPMMSLGQPQLQMNKLQVIPMTQQSAPSTPQQLQQSMMLLQQSPRAPIFQPLQPPGMRYDASSHQFQ